MRVEWSERASTRIEEIYEYLKAEAGKRTARKIVDKIYSRVDILAQNPQAGQREELLQGRDEEFRYLVQGNYKIIYWIETDRITISTLFDCRQNPEKMQEEAER